MIRVTYVKVGQIGEYELVRHSGSGNLFVAWYDAGTRQVVRATLRTANAVEASARIQTLADNGIKGDPRPHLKTAAPPTLRTVLEAHRSFVDTLPSHATENYHIDLLLNSDIADKRIAALGPLDWSKLRTDWLALGSDISTVSRRLSTVRAALRAAKNNRIIHDHPTVTEFRTKNHVRSAPPKGPVLSTTDLAQLYDNLASPHTQVWFALLLATAARTSAILELTDKSIDLDAGLMFLNPEGRVQTSKWRPCLPITDNIRTWLTDIPPGNLISYHGKPVGNVKTARRGAVRRAGINPRANSYSVRHSLARYMLDRGNGGQVS